MVCTNCGTANEAGRKFCKQCAAPLARACPACGAANGADAKFCGECATPLVAGVTSAGPPVANAGPGSSASGTVPPVAERRLVHVLFADLVGFTALAEGRDAEDTRELLSRYFDQARDVVGRYGGTVEKFIGDAVMAVWGAPTAHEDDAERAVRAALELVDAVTTLGPGISARAGVLTGEAAVTIGATNQGLVAGDLVNTASRLQAAAPPGTVLVGEATQRATSRSIAFESAGEQALKGKAAPIPAWRALRVVAERGGRNRSETLEAPFVGRDDELRLLKDLFHATTRERRARLVSVIGPAGIGKTRLAWEFLKYLDGLVETVRYHDGRSPAYGEGVTFWALGEMVRGRAGLLETDDEPTTRARIGEALATYVPDPEERRWIEPALLALLGVESSAHPEELFGAWRTFFERMAAEAPVVMVFEDHHHADPGLLDFVDHLLEWSRNVPIYVVTLARPELLERRPAWGAGTRNFTSLRLEPLPDPWMRELLVGLVPGLPDAAARSIVARADGIPLYAVETVRMLLADGRLALEDGSYRPVGDLTDLAVPETLTALIASRLDALAPDERALVSDAAVLGQSFTVAGLAAVSGLDAADLEVPLRSFVRRELLTRDTDPRSPERGQYAFVQALIREVAYHTLAKAERKRRHLAAARFFESLETDEIAGGLAGHYLAARANATRGPEADALAAQARIALVAAADRAIALGSHEQAVTLLRQGLDVTTDPAEEAELLERAGDAAASASRHDDAEALLRRAVERHRERGDRRATARATASLGRALLTAFRTEPAVLLLERAAEEFGDLDDDPDYLAVLSQLARGYMLSERFSEAVAIADRVLPGAEWRDLVTLVADTLVTKGSALGPLARTYEGSGTIETGLHVAERHGLTVTALRARLNWGVYHGHVDPRATLESDRVGLAEARRVGQRRYALMFLTNGASNGLWAGDWDWALPDLAELLAGQLAAEDRFLVLARLAIFRAWRGEGVDDLLAEIDRLVERLAADPSLLRFPVEVRAVRDFAAGAFADAAAANRQLARVDIANARMFLTAAARASLLAHDARAAVVDLEALEATGVHGPWVGALRASIRAGLAALDGRPADALALYREAIRGLREVGVPLDEALTAIEMVSLLDPSHPEVAAAAAAAREILVRLGAAPFLARLEAALARSPELLTTGSRAD